MNRKCGQKQIAFLINKIWQKFKFLSKAKNFSKNRKLGKEFRLWSKIKNLEKNCKSVSKSTYGMEFRCRRTFLP